MVDRPGSWIALTGVIGFVSGLLSAGLKGVLNNLREENKYYQHNPPYYEDPKTGSYTKGPPGKW